MAMDGYWGNRCQRYHSCYYAGAVIIIDESGCIARIQGFKKYRIKCQIKVVNILARILVGVKPTFSIQAEVLRRDYFYLFTTNNTCHTDAAFAVTDRHISGFVDHITGDI